MLCPGASPTLVLRPRAICSSPGNYAHISVPPCHRTTPASALSCALLSLRHVAASVTPLELGKASAIVGDDSITDLETHITLQSRGCSHCRHGSAQYTVAKMEQRRDRHASTHVRQPGRITSPTAGSIRHGTPGSQRRRRTTSAMRPQSSPTLSAPGGSQQHRGSRRRIGVSSAPSSPWRGARTRRLRPTDLETGWDTDFAGAGLLGDEDGETAGTNPDLLLRLQYERSTSETAFNKYLFTASNLALGLKQYGKYVPAANLRRTACVP